MWNHKLSEKASQWDKPFYINISKFYKIWFSQDPQNFLGIHNQLRFVRMRTKNPNAKLFFMYSSKCLTQKACFALKLFCEKYNITPFDFDVQLFPLLRTNEDKKLYEYARQELEHMRNKSGGNAAAASDCVRILRVIIELCGIYSDFDTTCSFNELLKKNKLVEIEAPVLLNINILPLQEGYSIHRNADFLAFAVDKTNAVKLCNEAVNSLERIQKMIIYQYAHSINSENILPASTSYNPVINTVAEFLIEHPKCTIFEYRAYVAALPESQSKYDLYLASVATMSGGQNYICMYDIFGKLNQDHSIPIPIPYDKSWLDYLELQKKSSIEHYTELDECIFVKRAVPVHAQTEEKENYSDLSWTTQGKKEKDTYEKKLEKFTVLLQRYYKKRKPTQSESSSDAHQKIEDELDASTASGQNKKLTGV